MLESLADTVNLLMLDLLGDGLEGLDGLGTPLDADQRCEDLEDGHEEQTAGRKVDAVDITVHVWERDLAEAVEVKGEKGV